MDNQHRLKKAFPHNSHTSALSLAWVTCFLKVEYQLEAFPQVSQTFGVSPVWSLMCSFIYEYIWKNSHMFYRYIYNLQQSLSHISQMCGFSPVGTLMWTFNANCPETFPTSFTNIWSLTCVNFPMLTFWTFCFEAFSTCFTNVQSLTCLNLYVQFE